MVNGYYRTMDTTKGKRSEYAYNHVDRVRLNQLPSTPPGCPIPGSRRRQAIAHHLDLATTQGAHQYYPYLQFNQRQVDCNGKNHLNLHDYYSHIQAGEPQQYEENYYESYANNYHDENDYSCLKENVGVGNDVCSLRRTRSLAVIREETYNDLQINSVRNSRRSQLIPRAKLVNRSFAKERYGKKKRREEDSTAGSSVDTQTSDTRESDDYYTNLKRLDSVKIFRSSWQTEKSDLESINSDYFKNSQHQHSQFVETTDTLQRSKSDGQFQVLEIEIHQESSVLPETTTSNSDHSDSSIQGPGEYTSACTETEGLPSSSGTLTSKKEKNPVISYDSIYLSSEDSSGDTLLRSAICTEATTPSETDSLAQVSIDDTASFDRLYTKVQKSSNSSSKPKILSVTTKRGALERLTSISTSQILKTNDVRVIDSYRPNLLDNHYHSLPDINIGRSLKVSERIDAKLRSSYKRYQNQNTLDNSSSGSSRTQRRKRARQREFSEIDSLASANISLITVDDSIFSNDSNHEKSSLVEKERHQSEIEIAEEALLPSNDSHTEVLLPEANNSQEIRRLSNEKSLQTDFLLNHSTQNFSRQLQIIVTDSQNNIIEEDSIESAANKVLELPDNNNNSSEWNFNEISNSDSDRNDSSEKSELKDSIDNCQKNSANKNASESVQISNDIGKNPETANCCPRKGILKKDCHRNRKAEIHFPPPPPASCTPSPTSKTKTFQDIFKTDCPIIAAGVYSNDEQVILKNFVAAKMSRPQVLHVIDSKRHQADSRDRKAKNGNVEKEFLERVDSARCYWSKITNDENEPVSEINPGANDDAQRNFVKSLEDEVDSTNSGLINTSYMSPASKTSSTRLLEHGLESFCPTVEIIELNGEKQATIVKAHDVDDADFDHVRYKVMKPKEFRKDILNRSKKEAQFDGLIQYLQDYSFQELLSNNNIVIIEPVRTKIEKPSESATKLEPLNCKITGGSGTDTKSTPSKHHFFYQPVRVNRELLEEELPNPDTVRNVRKFFEDHVLQKQSTGTAIKSNTLDSVAGGKRRGLRYLTIDTSYGSGGALRKWDSASLSSGVSSGDLSSPCECNEDHHHHHHHHHHQHHQQHHGHGDRRGNANDDDEDDDDGGQDVYTSEENLCEDEMCGGESYYVSEDVLEKIRECGSTVTYYGGRVVNNRSPELSPMTRAIMQEIHGKDIVDNYDGSMKAPLKANKSNVTEMCSASQPNNCLHDDAIDRKYRDNKHLGIQFKLVKSNSCSSRLELVGTDKCTQRRSPTALLLSSSSSQPTPHNEHNRSPSPTCNPEESVRELVNRLESGTIKNSSAPRIIESKCIEKSYRRSLPPAKPVVEKDNGITINNHHIGTKEYLGLVDIINHVTVNNHLGWNAPTPNHSNNETTSHTSPTANSIKVPRNKNVDLAFTMNRARQPSKLIASMTPSATTKSLDPLNHTDTANTTNETNNRSPDGAVETCPGQGSNSQCENNKIDLHSSPAPLVVNGALNSSNGVTPKKDNFSTDEKNEENSEPKMNGCGPAMTSKIIPQNGQQPVVASPTAGSTTPIKLLEKHYVANDRRLIEQRKYDEIEFEEFEVYSPGMVCHDQKDSQTQMNGDPREDPEVFETFEERI